MNKIFVSFLSTIFLISCSTTEKGAEKKESNYENYIAENKLEAVDKINAFRYQGWRSLDFRFLIVNTSATKQYLIQLNAYCQELRNANAIVINNQGSTLRTKFDSIRVASFPRAKCLIKTIYPITNEQADEITALSRY